MWQGRLENFAKGTQTEDEVRKRKDYETRPFWPWFGKCGSMWVDVGSMWVPCGVNVGCMWGQSGLDVKRVDVGLLRRRTLSNPGFTNIL